jgi:hypothetical protein
VAANKTRRIPAKRSSRLKRAARQVAVDADQVRQDLDKLLASLENLSVEALKEVSDRALSLIAEKTEEKKRSMVDAVIGGALNAVSGLFSRSEPAKKKRPTRKRAAEAGRAEGT